MIPMLTGLVSLASTHQDEPVRPPWIETDHRRLRGRTVEAMCVSEKLFIGEVHASKSFDTTHPGTKVQTVRTDLQFVVLHDFLDSAGSSFSLTVPGGTTDIRRVISTANYPRAEIGARYLLGVVSLKEQVAEKPKGYPILTVVLDIDPDTPLPSAEDLDIYYGNFRSEFCRSSLGGVVSSTDP